MPSDSLARRSWKLCRLANTISCGYDVVDRSPRFIAYFPALILEWRHKWVQAAYDGRLENGWLSANDGAAMPSIPLWCNLEACVSKMSNR